MTLPFSREAFFGVFRAYNEAVWPAQWALYGLALLCLLLVSRRSRGADRALSAVLALLWGWMGIVYHWAFFAEINPAARLFGLLFVVEAGLLLWLGTGRGHLRFGRPPAWRAVTGGALLVYALGIYPLLNRVSGHAYPESPTFGAPCPTTIFTLGLLFFLLPPYPRSILAVPIAWCAVGGSAAFLLGVPQDLGLVAAGVLAILLVFLPGRALPGRASEERIGS